MEYPLEMMKRSLHILLALTFALLQCAAPLVHAHVNGENSGLLPPPLETQHHLSDLLAQANCVIEAAESLAISLAPEFQRNDHPAIPQSSSANIPNSLQVVVVKFHPSPAPSGIFFSPYSKSLSQAPPRLG